MALSIKNPQTEELARRLAASTGESVTGAVTVALRERLDRLRGADADGAARRADALRDLAADAGARWVEPFRSAEHGDLLYDERGLPR